MWNYNRDEPNNPPLNDDDPPTINYNADPITNSESFKYKSSITGKTSNSTVKTLSKEIQKLRKILKFLFHWHTEAVFGELQTCVWLIVKYFLTLTWSKNCVLTDITTQTARAAQWDNPARKVINGPTNATFKITDTKLYASVVTLSTKMIKHF